MPIALIRTLKGVQLPTNLLTFANIACITYVETDVDVANTVAIEMVPEGEAVGLGGVHCQRFQTRVVPVHSGPRRFDVGVVTLSCKPHYTNLGRVST